MRKYNVNHDFFESIDTEEKAYWLGFIGADGCVSERYNYKGNKCSTLYVCLQEQDEAVLVALKHHLNAENPILRRITNKNKKFESKQVYLAITSNKLCDDLIKLGVTPSKTFTLKMPDIKNDLIKHFIRGYFDGDGHIGRYIRHDKNKTRDVFNFEIVGASFDVLNSINCYFKLNEIKTNIYVRKSNGTYRLVTSSLCEISKIINHIYSGSNVYLERKYLKSQEILNLCRL